MKHILLYANHIGVLLDNTFCNYAILFKLIIASNEFIG